MNSLNNIVDKVASSILSSEEHIDELENEQSKRGDSSKVKEINKVEVRQSPRLEKLKQMKIAAKQEKGKNKENSDDDDFVEILNDKRTFPRLVQTQLNFKTLKQDEAIVVNEKGMCSKKVAKLRALDKPVILVNEKGMNGKKPRRKNSQAIAPMSGSFRCCTKIMVAVTQNMKMTLLESHKEAMLKTPFGQFFNLFFEKRIRSDIMSRTNNRILVEIIKRYSVKEDAFLFGEGPNAKFVKILPKHVALTFGLPLHGTKVVDLFIKFRFDPDQSTFLVKHELQHPGDIQKNVMTSKIKSLMGEEGSENDFCRMVVLLMSATIFFPNSNHSIGKSFVVHLENLETMKKLGWTTLIYSDLLKKLRNTKDNHRSISACVIPLLIWLCEITGIVEPRKNYIAGSPRIGKWNFTKLAEAWDEDFLKNITKDQIKDDFQQLGAAEKLLLKEVIIQQEDDKPKDYEQIFEENIELKAEIANLKRRIDELEIERSNLANNKVENNYGSNNGSEGASKPPKKLKLKLKLDRSQILKEYVEMGDEKRQEERVEVQQEEGQQEECHEIYEVQQEKPPEDDVIGMVEVQCNMDSEVHEEATNQARVEKRSGNLKRSKRVMEQKQKKEAKQKTPRTKKRKVDGSAVIEVDELQTRDRKVVKVRILKEAHKSKHFGNIEEKHKARVSQFFGFATGDQYAYEDETCQISGRAVEDLMFDGFTGGEIINFFTKWLKSQEDTNVVKSLYVSAYAWTHVKAKQQQCKKKALDVILQNHCTDDIKYVFIPMNTSKSSSQFEGYHWTLLVLNCEERTCAHYNSLKPRRANRACDPYFNEAEIMAKEVIKVLKSKKVGSTRCKGVWKETPTKATCPQQGETVDCGVYILKFIDIISKEERMYSQTHFQEEISEFKASLATMILTDPNRSWKIEKNCEMYVEEGL